MGILVQHRLLLEVLTQRDLAARYRGSVLGFLWTLMNPVLQAAVYVLVFRHLTGAIRTPGYETTLFVGLLPWTWLAGALMQGGPSLVLGAPLVLRSAVPPQVLPAVVVLAHGAHFVLALPVAMALVIVSGGSSSWSWLALPVAVVPLLVFLYAITLAAAALTTRLRDVQFLVQNGIGIWFLLTPIAWPVAMAPERLRAWLAINPAAALILPFQQILAEGRWPDARLLLAGSLWATGSMLVAVHLFERHREAVVEAL